MKLEILVAAALCMAGIMGLSEAWRFKIHHPHGNLHLPDHHNLWMNHHGNQHRQHQDNLQRIHSLGDWDSIFDDPFFHQQIWPWAESMNRGCQKQPDEANIKEQPQTANEDQYDLYQPEVQEPEYHDYTGDGSLLEELRRREDGISPKDEATLPNLKDYEPSPCHERVKSQAPTAEQANSLSGTLAMIQQKKEEIRKLEELLELQRQEEELLRLQKRQEELQRQQEEQAKRLQEEYHLHKPNKVNSFSRQERENSHEEAMQSTCQKHKHPQVQKRYKAPHHRQGFADEWHSCKVTQQNDINLLNKNDNQGQQKNPHACGCQKQNRDELASSKEHNQRKETKEQWQRKTKEVPQPPPHQDKSVYSPGHKQTRQNSKPQPPTDTKTSPRQGTDQIRSHQIHDDSQKFPQDQQEHRHRTTAIAELNVPGYFPKDIQVHTVGSKIHIHGAQACSCSDSCVAREFERIVPLPEGVDTSTVEALLDKDGQLAIRGTSFFDGKESRKHREVQVQGLGIPMHQPIPTCSKGKKGFTSGKLNAKTGEIHKPEVFEEVPSRINESEYDDVTIEAVD